MELKDKLKKLRKERELTQTELAQAIFVSRSAVAKWENGLGLPSQDSMEALQEFYQVSLEEISTSEPEAVIVQKNQRLRKFCYGFGLCVLAVIALFSICLPFWLQSGQYAPAPEMAAGAFADLPYIDTGDYRFYYSSFEGDWEDGCHWASLSTFRPVRMRFWGCTVSKDDYDYRLILRNNYMVGKLYSIKGREGYYNLVICSMGSAVDAALLTMTQVRVDGVTYPVEEGFFFVTPEPVEAFWLDKAFYYVE